MSRDSVRVMATGDVFPDLEDGASAFRSLTPVFDSGDIVFGNCEGVYSDRPAPAATHIVFGGAPRERGSMLGAAGFDVMTLANNHAGDGGYDGLTDTIEVLKEQGIAVTGAGGNLAEAAAPAVLHANGRSVAFLGFAASFPVGYEARQNRAGIAPFRIETYYRNPMPNFWDPGVEPEVVTKPLGEDFDLLRDAIIAAREQADHVVIAFHQGTNAEVRNAFVPKAKTHDRIWKNVVQQCEIETARLAIDLGADAVICHQHAALRGMEIYRGKPIFYGMGALVHHFHRKGKRTKSDVAIITDWDEQEYPYWPYEQPTSRFSGIAVLDFEGEEIHAGFIPAIMLPDGSTEPLQDDDPRADSVVRHLEQLNADEDFNVRLVSGMYGERWRIAAVKPR